MANSNLGQSDSRFEFQNNEERKQMYDFMHLKKVDFSDPAD